MNKMRMIGFVGGAVVIVAIILLALGFNAAPTAKGSTSSNIGMEGSVSSSTYVGMGYLGAGWPSAAVKSGGMSASKTYVGMGYLGAGWPSAAVKSGGMSAKSYVGMGDVQRYDSDSFVQSRNGR